MTSLSGQTSWAKMTSPGGKLTALGCHPTKKVNKAEEQTCLSTKDIERLKIDCLSFVMCPLLAQLKIGFFSFIFVAAVYRTNEANKAGLKQSIFLGVYALNKL
jgi:hypothetical protein